MRNNQISIKINRFNDQAENGNNEQITVYADSNNVYEALFGAFKMAVDRFDNPAIAKECYKITVNETTEIKENNCDFCDKIYTIEEYQKMFDEDWWDCMGTYLIKQEDGSVSIYYACDDWYYNANAVDNVKYCPCCGRKLV